MIRGNAIFLSVSLFFVFSCSHPIYVTSAPIGKSDEGGTFHAVRADVMYAESSRPEKISNGKPGINFTSDKEEIRSTKDKPAGSQERKETAGDSPASIDGKAENKKAPEKGKEEKEPNGQDALDNALYLLAQARSLWEKGELDDALASLDEAYAEILDVNGDPELSRQKDDLRFMISKLIVQVVASRHRVTVGKKSEIPLIMNADVEKEIRSFQTVERGFFLRSYQRSGLYMPVILKQLQEAGLPKELAWLPLVESGFQVHVLSRARALGLWQFIPSTGYKFDLKRDRWVDERMDVEKSTRAAIAYLKELHELFGDWLTVLAAYNCGEGKVLRVISRQHINYLDHFWDLYRQLPHETARYVPRFLATLHIIRNPKKYGMDLSENPDKPIPYEVVKSGKCMRLEDIAKHLSISKEVMTSLNSELRLQMTPEQDYDLRVPKGKAQLFANVADQIPKWEPPRQASKRFIRHRVRKGETIGSLARRYNVTRRDIAAANHLSAKRQLKVGQKIRIPIHDYRPAMAKGKGKKKRTTVSAASAGSEKIIRYKVKKGDTLQSLASRFNTTTAEIRTANGIKGSKILVNQVLKIRNHAVAKAETGSSR